MKPYYSQDGIDLYLGDCREVLPTIAPGAICISDPPYNIGTPQLTVDTSRGSRVVGGDFGSFDNDAPEPVEWFPLLPVDLAVCFYGSKGIGRLIQAAGDTGWETVQDFHWCKTNPPVPMRSVGFSWGTETGYVFRRNGTKHKHNNEAGISPNWKTTPICGGSERSEHPTQKPLSVMKWLVNHWSFPGDTILDPFAGSGTTLVAAKHLGRKAIGIEKNERYCEIAVYRLSQRVFQFTE